MPEKRLHVLSCFLACIMETKMLNLTHIMTDMTIFLLIFLLPIAHSIINSNYQKTKATNNFFRPFYTYKQTLLVIKNSLR